MTKKYVGLSLSGCISDLINGKKYLSDVAFIIAGTCAETDGRFCYLIQERYANLYDWKYEPLMVMRLAFKLWSARNIYEPRVTYDNPPNPGAGVWLEYYPEKDSGVLCKSCRRRWTTIHDCVHDAERICCLRCDECFQDCADSTFKLCDSLVEARRKNQ